MKARGRAGGCVLPKLCLLIKIYVSLTILVLTEVCFNVFPLIIALRTSLFPPQRAVTPVSSRL